MEAPTMRMIRPLATLGAAMLSLCLLSCTSTREQLATTCERMCDGLAAYTEKFAADIAKEKHEPDVHGHLAARFHQTSELIKLLRTESDYLRKPANVVSELAYDLAYDKEIFERSHQLGNLATWKNVLKGISTDRFTSINSEVLFGGTERYRSVDHDKCSAQPCPYNAWNHSATEAFERTYTLFNNADKRADVAAIVERYQKGFIELLDSYKEPKEFKKWRETIGDVAPDSFSW
jgi:hypothetical protein